jgi:ribosome recycling factor
MNAMNMTEILQEQRSQISNIRADLLDLTAQLQAHLRILSEADKEAKEQIQGEVRVQRTHMNSV